MGQILRWTAVLQAIIAEQNLVSLSPEMETSWFSDEGVILQQAKAHTDVVQLTLTTMLWNHVQHELGGTASPPPSAMI